MISFRVSSDGLDELIERLADLSYRATDLRGLAEQIGVIMAEDVAQKALAGEDKDGEPFAPLSDATFQWSHGRGPGPPLAPDDYASRLISGFEVEVNEAGFDHFQVIGSWPSFPELRFHVDGFRNAMTGRQVPARDPVGIRPQGWALIEDALDVWTLNVVNGT